MRRIVPLLFMGLVLCSSVAMSSTASQGRVDPIRVRRELRQILSSPEYNRTYRQNALEKALARIGKSILEAIQRFFGWLGDHLSFEEPTGVGVISWIGAWVAVIAFLVLVAFVIWKLLGNASARVKKDALADDVLYEMLPAKQLISQAAKLAEAGDYRAAFKTAYLASIAYLDEIRALRFERSRTNWEYLRELKQGGHDNSHGELQPLTLDFDRKIYGREDCVKQDYLNATAVYDRLSSEDAK